jgi:hypothetical protein
MHHRARLRVEQTAVLNVDSLRQRGASLPLRNLPGQALAFALQAICAVRASAKAGQIYGLPGGGMAMSKRRLLQVSRPRSGRVGFCQATLAVDVDRWSAMSRIGWPWQRCGIQVAFALRVDGTAQQQCGGGLGTGFVP